MTTGSVIQEIRDILDSQRGHRQARLAVSAIRGTTAARSDEFGAYTPWNRRMLVLGYRDQGGQLGQEVERFEHHSCCPVAPGSLHPERNAAIGFSVETPLGERGAKDVARESLEADTIPGSLPGVKVELVA